MVGNKRHIRIFPPMSVPLHCKLPVGDGFSPEMLNLSVFFFFFFSFRFYSLKHACSGSYLWLANLSIMPSVRKAECKNNDNDNVVCGFLFATCGGF